MIFTEFTKKAYKKPELFFEDFALMDAITASCATAAQHGDKYTCAWLDDSTQCNIFTEPVSVCTVTEDIADLIEVPQDAIFSS